ncbi:MAG TPA: hypothetical protein VK158_04580 [Acidobacteriota bacterium]|nr:hypothetical protein [Acidobacteriota bacterium]
MANKECTLDMKLELGQARLRAMTPQGSYAFGKLGEASFDLSREEINTFFEDRAKVLKSKEWQRWVPVLNLYRYCADQITHDDKIVSAIYPQRYNVANIIYTMPSTVLAAGYIVGQVVKHL